jgi:hypothetical protein
MVKKLSLFFIFGGAVFVMACGILRAALVIEVSPLKFVLCLSSG